ncbi:ArgS-related anticodon-binding protein NrtL [Streptomyces sp. 8L]|uniref:ArgS-related anticodon-binding protein NrtL n=1 Tax=Streptomyces sp. 8L TaxID=2877242 RepID=UPI001CD55F06|nr:DALR anticodon-binding domain-containing protein [Streptomyces sp. 8L]MCA1220982.1 arginine--tRNA ligase [Streptomyces sp. 8L]
MTPAELSRTVRHAVCRAVHDGELSVTVPDTVRVDRPRPGGRGDWTTNAALRLAAEARLAPREVAEVLRGRLAGAPALARVDITGPGFLNFTLAAPAGAATLARVLAEGARYGHGDALAGRTLVFAPAAEPRAAAWTAAVVRLLRAQGADASVAPGGTETVQVTPAPVAYDPGALGPDAARWALLRPAAHDRPRTDPAWLLAQRETNPLFTVRYAHARARAALREAPAFGLRPEVPVAPGASAPVAAPVAPGAPAWTGRHVTPDGLAPGAARTLLDVLADHPRVLAASGHHRAPDRLARHLEAVADHTLRFLTQCPPLPAGDEKPSAAHRARLALAEAAGTVLAGGLSLLGIDAPAHL